MPKISVVVPVYNTEKYIEKCLNSILAQKNVSIEIIIVNDGSTDNSASIIRNYETQFPDIIKYFEKENGGLSDARNYGVSKATGDYICFVDSDDFINEGLFDSAMQYMLKKIDLIKYKCVRVDENYNEIERIDGPIFECKSGQDAFNTLYAQDVLIEPAWLYIYRKDFYESNNFSFPINKYHEDWAIVPFILITASTVVSTNVYGYNYVQSSNSITRNNNDEKIAKRAYDMLEHYDNLISRINSAKIDKRFSRKL